jgi:hypothetical protein
LFFFFGQSSVRQMEHWSCRHTGSEPVRHPRQFTTVLVTRNEEDWSVMTNQSFVAKRTTQGA